MSQYSIKLTSTTILKLTVTLSGSTVPSEIPSTLALMTDDPTTVSGIGSRIGNNVDCVYRVNEKLISSASVTVLMLAGNDMVARSNSLILDDSKSEVKVSVERKLSIKIKE